METATLDDFMALNDQLAALSQAGVPPAVDLGRDQNEVVARLEKINALVARRVSQGATLAQAIAGDDAIIQPAYRGLVQMGLRCGDVSAGLRESVRLARAAQQSRQTMRLALIYPAVIAGLAFVGLVGFCLFLVPVLDRTYHGLEVRKSNSLQVLGTLRRTLPFWVALGPLGVVIALVAGRNRSRSGSPGGERSVIYRLPVIGRMLAEERAAVFAESLAMLLERGGGMSEALDVAADTWNDRSHAQATRALAASMRQGQPASAQGHLIQSFPPFLRWMLLEGQAEGASGLRTVAEVYRRSARRRQQRLRVVAPLAAAVVIGGGVTLLYALALFLPVVEMLRGLGS